MLSESSDASAASPAKKLKHRWKTEVSKRSNRIAIIDGLASANKRLEYQSQMLIEQWEASLQERNQVLMEEAKVKIIITLAELDAEHRKSMQRMCDKNERLRERVKELEAKYMRLENETKSARKRQLATRLFEVINTDLPEARAEIFPLSRWPFKWY
jgi:hypothetical protein